MKRLKIEEIMEFIGDLLFKAWRDKKKLKINYEGKKLEFKKKFQWWFEEEGVLIEDDEKSVFIRVSIGMDLKTLLNT